MAQPIDISPPVNQSDPLLEKRRNNDPLPVILRENRYYTTSKGAPGEIQHSYVEERGAVDDWGWTYP